MTTEPVAGSEPATRPSLSIVHVMTVPQTLWLVAGSVEAAKRAGHEVRVVASPGGELDRFAHSLDVEAHPLAMSRAISPVADLGALFRLTRLLRRLRPRLVHAHTPKGGFLGMLAAWIARVPIRVYQMRGLLTPTARGMRRALYAGVERTSCALAHRVVCQSRSLREVAIADRLAPPEKMTVLVNGSNGIDGERFDPRRWAARATALRGELGIAEGAPVIGYVGRLVRDKGILELIEAWGRLREAQPEAHLLLVGPRERRDAVPASAIEKLRADARVHGTGLVKDVAPYYALMDVLALPSYREGFPNTALEAAAMAVPVVAGRVTGCVDAVVDGVTGRLVAAGDADELATALDAYLVSRELRERHGRAARERALEEFRPEPIHRAQLALYEELAGGPATRRRARSEGA